MYVHPSDWLIFKISLPVLEMIGVFFKFPCLLLRDIEQLRVNWETF